MIFLLGIDTPDVIFVLNTIYDILHSLKRGDHGMVDIVIAVLAVTSDTVEVVDGL